MEIRQVGAELYHVGGQTDMRRLIVALRNFVNVPKNGNIFGVTSRNKFSYERR
jgi:hypothetical protein